MIEIRNVGKQFGAFKALENINITIEEGKIYGIIGENGAGKTTLIQCLVGIYAVDEGEILIDHKNPFENREVKLNLAYVADRNQFFKAYKVKEMVDFFDLTYPSFSREKFKQYNQIFKLDVKKKIRQLSKGMQMRLSLMLNLAISPTILVLDEPTSGLDAIAKKDVLDIILQEVEERKMTVVISSHHLSELEKICDEITIINHGKVTYQSSIDSLKEKIKKHQLVFKDKAPENLIEWEEVIKVENIGSVYYIVTKDFNEAFKNKLKQNGATLIEPIGLTLEEIFIYTSTAQGVGEERL